MSDSVRGVRSLSAVGPEATTRRRPDGGSVLVAAVAVTGVLSAVVVELRGAGAFPTHPVAVLALAAAAVAVRTAGQSAAARTRVPLLLLAWSLLAYLWLGVAACAVGGRLLVALWSAGWIPVNGLVVVVGLAAAAMPRSAAVLGAVTALATAGAAGLARPTRPFEGLPPAAPEVWSTRVPWLADSLVVLLSTAMVAATVAVVVRVLRAHVTERRHLVNCAATTSMGAGLVVMCLALASLRDPGDIDPATGSVAYLLAVALTAGIAAYGNAPSRWPLRVVLAYWSAALAVVVGVQASQVTPAALGVVLTVAVAGVATAGAMAAVAGLERWLTVAEPRLVAPVPLLSPRENEVLAAVAAGATNAGIAADLFLSERTVEQHLRSVFAKLDLGSHDSSNRRVRAAAVWWQHQSHDARADGSA